MSKHQTPKHLREREREQRRLRKVRENRTKLWGAK